MKGRVLYPLWIIGLILCFTPFLVTARIFWLEDPEWEANWEGSHFAEKRLAFISGLWISLPLAGLYLYKTRAIIQTILRKWRAYVTT